MAIESSHKNSEFSHKKWWIFPSLCQRLPEGETPLNPIKPPFSYGFPRVLPEGSPQKNDAPRITLSHHIDAKLPLLLAC